MSEGIWTMTESEFNVALAAAWDDGATTGWKQSGEGWNFEYPDESTGKCSVYLGVNPYREPSA